ncbi:hypothetical protein BGZ76_005122 [Entomortierella beljakovae]|nr:hypothetical protein BGZ76_005122 [Entomortierella beljakovae]
MRTGKRTNSKLAAAAMAVTLVSSSIVSADHVYITKPSDTTEIYSGCPVDLGYRVQYSDMAILKWVQLQLLQADKTVVIDKLDYATRDQWGESRTRSISWQVPADLTPGEYTLSAFGNATYPCNDFKSGRRNRCEFYLEDQKALNIHTLSADQKCPTDAITATTLTPNPAATQETPKNEVGGDILNVSVGLPTNGENSGDSSNSYSQSTLDYISKNLALDKGGASQTGVSTGTTGYSNPLQLTPVSNDNNTSTVNITAETQQQNQIIRMVIQESKDFDAKNETVTLNNGTTVPLMKMFPDKLTANRFLETLDLSNKTLANTTSTITETTQEDSNTTHQNMTATSIDKGLTNDWKHLTSTQLLEELHNNSSLITLAPSTSTHSISGTQMGRNFAQHEDGDQIQDKTSGTNRLFTSTSSTAFLSILIGCLFSTTV